MNKLKLSVVAIGLLTTLNVAHAEGAKDYAPNQYDCTVDELELFVMKRTENLRKESAMVVWEDYKKTSQKMKSAPSNTSANGSVQSEVAAASHLKKTGGESAEAVDDCPLFYEDLPDLPDMDMSDLDLGNLISGGLDDLKKLATEQMAQLAESLTNALKAGICERLSTDYLTELGTGILDDALKEEIGYTSGDISKGNFANRVINDSLQDEYGTSNARLLNVMDEDLNNNRENYMKRQTNSQLNIIEKDIVSNIQD